MLSKDVEKFFENKNMTYLFILLVNKEMERLNNLPFTIRKNFDKKVTELALEHVATNNIPDYIFDQIFEEETEKEMV